MCQVIAFPTPVSIFSIVMKNNSAQIYLNTIEVIEIMEFT